ncbi:MAG: hypothetical protein J5762_06370 [Clostridia bacterium]|nr:hypothetical protein [Clostridia bacterium]
MIKIANFYCNQQKVFEYFLTYESRWHGFWNYLDKLKRQEIEETLKNSQQFSNESFNKKYLSQIKDEFNKQWGYKSDLTVKTSDNRQKLSLLIMREASAINYDEALINAFTRQFFYLVGDYVSSKARDIKTNGTNFETEVNDLLNQDIAFATENTTYQTYLIKDEKLQEKYNAKLKEIKIIKSSILYKPTFILKDGFSYNYKILDFSAEDLSGDFLEKQVDKYKRPDGQYVYKTVFMSREELCRILHKEYVVIQMDIQYKIDTYPGAIIQFDNK